MLTLAMERDAWVGTIEGSPSLQVLLDLEDRATSRPPEEGLLSIAVEGKFLLLVVRSRMGLGGEPWQVRIEATPARTREIETLLTSVPAIRVTPFCADGAWTAKYARGGMTIENPRRSEPHFRLVLIRFRLVTNRLAARAAEFGRG